MTILSLFFLNLEIIFLIFYLSFYKNEIQTYRHLNQIYEQQIVDFSN